MLSEDKGFVLARHRLGVHVGASLWRPALGLNAECGAAACCSTVECSDFATPIPSSGLIRLTRRFGPSWSWVAQRR
jgi:hypothetical protein